MRIAMLFLPEVEDPTSEPALTGLIVSSADVLVSRAGKEDWLVETDTTGRAPAGTVVFDPAVYLGEVIAQKVRAYEVLQTKG